MPKIDIAKLPVDTVTGYPEPFRRRCDGRARKRLGNAVGLDQFGVNLTRLKPGAASSLRHWHEQRGRVHLRARRRAGAVRGRRRDRAQARRRRGLEGRRRQRPLPDQPHRPRRASISRSARARSASACTIPTSIMRMERDENGARYHAQVRRAVSEGMSRGERRMTYINFKLDIDADGIALVTWDMPGRSMNVIDAQGDRGTCPPSSRRSRPTPRSRARSSPRARTRSAPAPISPCWRRSAATFAEMAKTQGEEAAATHAVRGEPQAVAALSAARDLRQAVGRGDQRHRARRRLRALPRLPSPRRRRQSEDARSACPRSRSACSPAPAARSASRA